MAKTIDLDKALTELETIVDELETGELDLDKAMKKFERGVALTRDCQTALASAEQRVSVLLAESGLDEAPTPLQSDDD